jgi:hypothetical protein
VVLHKDSRVEKEGHRCSATWMYILEAEEEIRVTIDDTDEQARPGKTLCCPFAV